MANPGHVQKLLASVQAAAAVDLRDCDLSKILYRRLQLPAGANRRESHAPRLLDPFKRNLAR